MRVVEEMKNALKNLENQGLLRFEEISKRGRKNIIYLEDGKKLISFASNDYLNLSQNKIIINAGIKALKEFGAGSSSSKFIEGCSFFYQKIKEEFKEEDCLIFPTGYMANLGLMQAIFTNEDIIFLDENSHNSSFEGAKLSGAKVLRYQHNSIKDLEEKLLKFAHLGKKIGIATETIFSMQGSVLCDSGKYFEIAKKYNAFLIIDEAHSFGLMDFQFPEYELHIKMGTFSKSIGVLGGYVCGNKIIIEYIRQFAKAGIYTTALPPSVLSSVLSSLKLIKSKVIDGKKAIENAKYFAKILGIKQESQIIFLEMENNEKALNLAKTLMEKGFFVKAIRRPTVKKAGIRISFNNHHKKVDIKKLVFIIKKQLN